MILFMEFVKVEQTLIFMVHLYNKFKRLLKNKINKLLKVFRKEAHYQVIINI